MLRFNGVGYRAEALHVGAEQYHFFATQKHR
jgi:hypothetical protein